MNSRLPETRGNNQRSRVIAGAGRASPPPPGPGRRTRDVATHLSAQIAELGPFELLTKGDELPVFAFKLRDTIGNYTVFDVSNALRANGWLLPAYTFPKNRQDLAALRVVKRGFTHDMADLLLHDIKRQLSRLEKQPAPVHDAATGSAFHH